MHTQHMPHIMIVNRLEANKEGFRPEGFDQIRPDSIGSLQSKGSTSALSTRKIRPIYSHPTFFPNKSAYEFCPGSEPRMITSSFFGVLIPEQSFWKDAKNVDHRFSVISPKKNFSHFVGLYFSPNVFSASLFFQIRKV